MELSTTEAFVLAIGALGLGIVMLIRGGNWTIDAAVYIARHFGISPLIVGFTIVAFGTSLPELIVSVNANLQGLPGIAMGNVLGSNIANILLVIGVSAAYVTIHVTPRDVFRDLMMMIVTTVVLLGLMMYGQLDRLVGFLMLGSLVGYTFWQYWQARHDEALMPEVDEPEFKTLSSSLIFLILGLAFIALGAEFLVRGAKVSAEIIGVPDAVIGLSVIALGTSLPELSTCLIACAKKQSDIVIGNIVGSNVFNILMILGVTAAIKPLHMVDVAPQLVDLDIWIVLGTSLLFTVLLLSFRKINRAMGVVFVAGYVAYILAIYALYLT